MKCEEVRSRLSWYMDLELPHPERGAIRDHLSVCSECSERLRDLGEADEGIRQALLDVRVPAGFAARVAAAAKPRPPSWKWLKPVALVAAALLILLSGVSIYVNTLQAAPLAIAVHGGESLHAGSIGALRVFVSNARGGIPVANAAVRLFLGEKDLGRFVTGAAGTIEGFFRVPDMEEGKYPLRLEVESSLGRDRVEHPVVIRREIRLLLTTDKPMYQPGQKIQMRALALNAFTLKPRPGKAEFEVMDSKGNRIFTKKTECSGFGIASAEMPLAEELNLGTWRIAVTSSGVRQERTVEVARYVLPKFGIDLDLDRASYRPGERIKGTVRAKYFFGKPVRGIARATVGREIVTGELREDGAWDFEAPASGEGMSKIDVAVTDTADHREAKSAMVVVSQEPLKVALVPEGGEVVPDLENVFYVLVSTPDGRPAKADVDLVVNGTATALKTDDLGVAKVTASSPYSIRLERARDESGQETREMEVHFRYSEKGFLVRLDKASYKAGETMTVSVLGAGADPVYVDLVKDGQLLLAKVAEKGRVEIDLPQDLFGTLQVIAYKRGPAPPVVRVAYVNLPDGLRLRPHPAKETFRPGEEMPVEFEVTDREGRPVQAALGISVVDEALFGLVESKMAGEKVWLSLAPELIDTRGFLKAEGTEVYQAKNASGAQAFVSGNGKGARPELLVRNQWKEKALRLSESVKAYNDNVVIALKIVFLLLLSWVLIFLVLNPIVSWVKETLPRPSAGIRFAVLALAVFAMFAFSALMSLGSLGYACGLFLLFVLTAAYSYGVVWWYRQGNGWACIGSGFPLLYLVISLFMALSDAPWSSYRRDYGIRWGTPSPQELDWYNGRSFSFFALWDRLSESSVESMGEAVVVVPPRRPSAPMAAMESVPAEDGVLERRSGAWRIPVARPSREEIPESVEPVRVRDYFPETLFWSPQLITDDRGRASLTLPPADSITRWRMLASAVARNGALGFEAANLRVFQDFFADIDFPVALTRGDRVHVPVAVYNYLKEPQTVAVRVQREPWFELLDEESKTVALKPSEVSVVYFGLKVREHGRKSLTVFADGKVKDALRRTVEVMEKGREVPVSASERIRGRHAFRIAIPEGAIEGANVIFARLTPGAGEFQEGLEGMIRLPYG